MAKETQKQKIERLEEEIGQLHSVIESQQGKLSELLNSADDLFCKSPYKKQLELEMETLRDTIKVRETRISHLENRITQKDDLIHKLNHKQPKHNARGAGRKEKLTMEQITEIQRMRASGETMRSIAEKYHCSPALVCKVCKN